MVVQCTFTVVHSLYIFYKFTLFKGHFSPFPAFSRLYTTIRALRNAMQIVLSRYSISVDAALHRPRFVQLSPTAEQNLRYMSELC